MATEQAVAQVPGPYWISVAEDGERQIKGRNGAILFRYTASQDAMANAHCVRLQKEHDRARRALLRAAPEMLEALEAIKEHLDAGEEQLAWERADSALALARGGSK